MALLRVPAAGGKPEPFTKLEEGEVTQRWPQVLPGGKAVLYTGHATTSSGFEDANIVVQPLPKGPRKILQRGGYHGRYLSSGHVVYVHESTLFAAPFDLGRLELTGPPVPVVEGICLDAQQRGLELRSLERRHARVRARKERGRSRRRSTGWTGRARRRCSAPRRPPGTTSASRRTARSSRWT